MGRERDSPQGDQTVGQELEETTGHQGPRLGLSQPGRGQGAVLHKLNSLQTSRILGKTGWAWKGKARFPRGPEELDKV